MILDFVPSGSCSNAILATSTIRIWKSKAGGFVIALLQAKALRLELFVISDALDERLIYPRRNTYQSVGRWN
jgi:hypothetical protein